MTNIVSFPGLGLEFELNRVAFSVFGHNIYWYGIIIAAGFLLAVDHNQVAGENARVAQNRGEYAKRYDALVERFETAKARLEEVQAAITEKQAQRNSPLTASRCCWRSPLYGGPSGRWSFRFPNQITAV